MQILNDSIVFFFILKIIVDYTQANCLFTTSHGACLNLCTSVTCIFPKALIGWGKAFSFLAINFRLPSAFTYAQPWYMKSIATLKSERTEQKTKGAFAANHQR